MERAQLPDGTDLVVRSIRPEDVQMEQGFVRALSGQTKYFRFMQAIKELAPEILVRFTQIDYDREMAPVQSLGFRAHRDPKGPGIKLVIKAL